MIRRFLSVSLDLQNIDLNQHNCGLNLTSKLSIAAKKFLNALNKAPNSNLQEQIYSRQIVGTSADFLKDSN